MSEPTAYAFTQLFSQLVGRDVKFAQGGSGGATKEKQVYGIYTVLPQETAIVVQADLPLLGSFAGALVGLQDDAVQERLAEASLDELLRDAIHEVLNIASTVVTNEGRAVFKKMVTDSVYCDGTAAQLLQQPDRKTPFDVTMEDYKGGRFTVLAQV